MTTSVLENKSGVVDALLLEIAKRIQLSPTNYQLAVDRYQTMNAHLNRQDSPLRGLVARLYPQGSMAIGSVISSKFENDEFDIDIVAELAIRADTSPSRVLDTLFHTLNGEKGSLYHGKVKRCSRCVQVQYSEMHLDITPAVLLDWKPDRTSYIFHANEKEPPSEHYPVVANPWGFAQWFQGKMPESVEYLNAFGKRGSDPVPDFEAVNSKARPLIALQLLKRWRNKVYDQREGRMPPSVMMSCLIAGNAGHRPSLFDELVAQSQYLLQYFSDHTRQGKLVRVENPACPGEDIFTDRWPENMDAQYTFTRDLESLNNKLAQLSKNRTVEGCRTIMADLFGEKPTLAAIQTFAERFGGQAHAGGLQHHGKSGAVALGASGIATGLKSTPSYATPKTTFFGSE